MSDVKAAREELTGHGAQVSEPFHFTAFGTPPTPGPDPNGNSYGTFATFSDPDATPSCCRRSSRGFPARPRQHDVATLVPLLREAEERHGQYEPTAPKHHWSGWYGAYIVARERGKTPEEAAKDAALYIEGGRQ